MSRVASLAALHLFWLDSAPTFCLRSPMDLLVSHPRPDGSFRLKAAL